MVSAAAMAGELARRAGRPASPATLYRILARHGWRKVCRGRGTPKPTRSPGGVQGNLPQLLASARADDRRPLRLIFMDEARFGRMNRPVRCWAPPGVRPVVDCQTVREYTYAYGAVSPTTGRFAR